MSKQEVFCWWGKSDTSPSATHTNSIDRLNRIRQCSEALLALRSESIASECCASPTNILDERRSLLIPRLLHVDTTTTDLSGKTGDSTDFNARFHVYPEKNLFKDMIHQHISKHANLDKIEQQVSPSEHPNNADGRECISESREVPVQRHVLAELLIENSRLKTDLDDCWKCKKEQERVVEAAERHIENVHSLMDKLAADVSEYKKFQKLYEDVKSELQATLDKLLEKDKAIMIVKQSQEQLFQEAEKRILVLQEKLMKTRTSTRDGEQGHNAKCHQCTLYQDEFQKKLATAVRTFESEITSKDLEIMKLKEHIRFSVNLSSEADNFSSHVKDPETLLPEVVNFPSASPSVEPKKNGDSNVEKAKTSVGVCTDGFEESLTKKNITYTHQAVQTVRPQSRTVRIGVQKMVHQKETQVCIKSEAPKLMTDGYTQTDVVLSSRDEILCSRQAGRPDSMASKTKCIRDKSAVTPSKENCYNDTHEKTKLQNIRQHLMSQGLLKS